MEALSTKPKSMYEQTNLLGHERLMNWLALCVLNVEVAAHFAEVLEEQLVDRLPSVRQ